MYIMSIERKAKDIKVGDWNLAKEPVVSIKRHEGYVTLLFEDGHEYRTQEDTVLAVWFGEYEDYEYFESVRSWNKAWIGKGHFTINSKDGPYEFLGFRKLEGQELVDRMIELGQRKHLLPATIPYIGKP